MIVHLSPIFFSIAYWEDVGLFVSIARPRSRKNQLSPCVLNRDAASRASVTAAVEFVVTHVMAMETSGPVAYMRVEEGFIILG